MPGALIAIAVLLVVGAVSAWVVLRDVPGQTADIRSAVDRLVEAVRTPAESQPDPGPVLEDRAPAAGADVESPEPMGEPRPATIANTVAGCIPSLSGLNEGSRLIAVDVTATNVDFIREHPNRPGTYVRFGCRYLDGGYGLVDAGRMVVPPMVGDPRRFPAEPIAIATLDADWFTTRIARAAAARAQTEDRVARIELAFFGTRGLVTQVSFDGALTDAEPVQLDARGDPLPEPVEFPQVQRMKDISEESARRGFRDLGQSLWTSGVRESVERMGKRYLKPGMKLRAIVFAGYRADLVVFDPASPQDVLDISIDEYGEASEPYSVDDGPSYCRRPFEIGEALRALDDTIRARGETVAAFEATVFEMAVLDCSADPKRPAWRLEGP